MKKRSLIRTAAFALIAGIFLLFTINYACCMAAEGTNKAIDTANTAEVMIDGSDFTPTVRLLRDAFNDFLAFIVMIVNIVAIALVSLICCTLFRITAVRRTTAIGNSEMNAARSIFFGSAGTALIVSLVITRFTSIIPVLIYIGLWWLNTWLICYLPMKDHYHEDADEAAAI